MSDYSIKYDSVSDAYIIEIFAKHFERKVMDNLDELANKMAKEVAAKIWAEKQDKIMANLDLSGLANLIAIHASEALKK